MASGVMALLTMLPDEAFMAWGWRTAFIASIVLVVLGTWIRSNIGESPSSRRPRRNRGPRTRACPSWT